MKKVRIAIAFCIIFISLVPNGFAWASPSKSLPEMPVPTVRAQLQNAATGENLTIPVTYKVQSAGEGRYVATYKINPGPELSVPLSYVYRGLSQIQNDVSASVRGEVRVYWWGDDVPSPSKLKIDYYQVKWQKLVSDVSWSNAKLTAYCWTNACPQTTKTVTCSSPGSWCKNTPPWRNVVQNWDNMGANYATGTITLKRGSSSWVFSLSVFVPGP